MFTSSGMAIFPAIAPLRYCRDLINGFGGSQYFNTNTTYGDTTGNIANTATMAGALFDNYSQGMASDAGDFFERHQ